jgi:hypothetical protein
MVRRNRGFPTVIFQQLQLVVAPCGGEGIPDEAPIRSALQQMISAPHGLAE